MEYSFDETTILNYFKNNLPIYPKCKLLEYFKMTKQNYYVDVKSGKQISTLIQMSEELNDPSILNRLLLFFLKHISIQDISDFVKKLKGKTDLEILTIFKSYSKRGGYIKNPLNIDSYDKCTRSVIFSQLYSPIIKKHFENVDTYLDVGCGMCRKTLQFGNSLGSKFIYGTDLKEWASFNNSKREKDIIFKHFEKGKSLPFEDKKFDIVSAFMVLHHVEELKKFIYDINRVLKKNACFFFTDHDVFSDDDRMLADIEHSIYYVLHENNLNYQQEYYATYYDWLQWNIILEDAGFKVIDQNIQFLSVKPTISPTRYFWCLLKKIKDI